MRTTITIDDGLLDEVRRLAAERRETVSKVIEDSVRESLLRRSDPTRKPFRALTFSGGGLLPGVDLENNAALLDVMEAR
jgi:Arc/MetJ family transcription regulator